MVKSERTEPFQPLLTVHEMVAGTRPDLELEYLAGLSGQDRQISQPRVQKPGLALAGFMEYLHKGRVQVLGNSEISFLWHMEPGDRTAMARSLVGHDIACFTITKGLDPPPELIRECDAGGVPLLRTGVVSSAAIYALGRFLEDRLAPTVQVHGVLMDIYGIGVLMLGDSGVGKSECAMDLIVRGHRIVSDDMVVVRRRAGVLTGTSPEMTRYHMELRGIGIINIEHMFGAASFRTRKRVEMVVRLEEG